MAAIGDALREASTCRVVSHNQESNVPQPKDMFIWYYVDFKAKLPDSLFQPKERTGRHRIAEVMSDVSFAHANRRVCFKI